MHPRLSFGRHKISGTDIKMNQNRLRPLRGMATGIPKSSSVVLVVEDEELVRAFAPDPVEIRGSLVTLSIVGPVAKFARCGGDERHWRHRPASLLERADDAGSHGPVNYSVDLAWMRRPKTPARPFSPPER